MKNMVETVLRHIFETILRSAKACNVQSLKAYYLPPTPITDSIEAVGVLCIYIPPLPDKEYMKFLSGLASINNTNLMVNFEPYKSDMINAVIGEQIVQGGYDTPSARSQAERWLGNVCQCMNEGLLATTDKSRKKLTDNDRPGSWIEINGKEIILFAFG